MKRFTFEVDKEFEVAGEIFRWEYPYWEDIAAVFDRDDEDLRKDDDEIVISVRSTIADYIDRITLFIDDDFNNGKTRWKALTKRKVDPVPHIVYAELYRYLLEVTSNPTPPETPSPSDNGQQTIEVTSTAESS